MEEGRGEEAISRKRKRRLASGDVDLDNCTENDNDDDRTLVACRALSCDRKAFVSSVFAPFAFRLTFFVICLIVSYISCRFYPYTSIVLVFLVVIPRRRQASSKAR
jgi:hypothetical protein